MFLTKLNLFTDEESSPNNKTEVIYVTLRKLDFTILCLCYIYVKLSRNIPT